MGNQKKKELKKKIQKGGARLASLLASEERWTRKLINGVQLTATCSCEMGERQVEKEDQ